MSKFIPPRVAVLLSSAVVLFLSGAAVAQTSLRYDNREYRFGAIFPGEPMARDVAYKTSAGDTVPARQFYVEQGTDQYLVTIVQLPAGPAVDVQAVDHAADELRKRGEVRFQFANDYDPGVPGRQLNILERNGRQLRASVYMWDHRLYITEASAAPGSLPAMQFEQSVTILDAAGNDLDTEGRQR